MKKRARFVREGQLAPPSGPEVYREIVNHAGYQRAIINRNPPLIDDEGYELDSDDDEERVREAMEDAAEFNPYARIRLETILAPLTAVTDLASHPTMSRPYTSKTLTDLTKQACDIMHKENAALWQVKHLQTRLVGDHTWIPCELMLGPNDINLYRDDYVVNGLGSLSKNSVNSDASMPLLENVHPQSNGRISGNGESPLENNAETGRKGEAIGEPDAPMTVADATAHASASESQVNGDKSHAVPPAPNPETEGQEKSSDEDKETTDTSLKTAVVDEHDDTEEGVKGKHSLKLPTDVEHEVIVNGIDRTTEQNGKSSSKTRGPQRMMNGSQVNHRAIGPASNASEPVDDMFIHPLFLAPRSARPDRDLGLPEGEAEDLRRLMQLYVQKQEEVCRGAKRLYEGLLRADRLRKTVFQWSKYEAHVGPNRDMSDGEDWYDKEEWGLEEDLKKGQDEEEEDTTQPTGKKTRNRR
ncbi:RXT2-like protein [Pseudomassariella vexata]|uniref:RXT2-like protein n=1 Tax=Pseudomassariella vexata TaxID=1141098 RepID=A0A1Y2DPJ1_9PEZI|nr:RXT2-like protein [Pseudomassariella vexata]ORY61198.1 RXT2-like protein [Pseudomassariella vexata]